MDERDFLRDAIAAMRDSDIAFARSENSQHYRDAHVHVSEMHAKTASLLATLSIAQDLRRIADALAGFSDNGESNDALRVNVLR